MSNEQEVVTESNESQDQQEGVEVQSAKDSGEQNEVEQKDSTERPEWLDPNSKPLNNYRQAISNWKQNFIQGVMKLKQNLLKRLTKKLPKMFQ